VQFLGTGAAGWKPSTTTERRNSSVLLDGKVLIDLTVSVRDMLPDDSHPEHIFYTHSHGDHYQPLEALKLGVKKVYVSDTWIDRAKSDFRRLASENKLPAPQFVTLKIGVPVTVEGLTFTPLPANHTTNFYEEQALIYLVEKGTTADRLGVRMLYATDTSGIMGKAARLAGIDSHKSDIPDRPITAFIMEATMGLGHEEDFRLFNHSTPEVVARIARMLSRTKRYTPPAGQPVYLTHISNPLHGSLQQDELNKSLPIPLRAASDGLEVVFRAVE
jgi:ribonuclease BN (tRNA processing enzyme)